VVARGIANNRSKMHDGFHPLDSPDDILDIAAITDHQFETRLGMKRSERFVPIEQSIQNADLVALLEKALDKQRTDVARPADHQHVSPLARNAHGALRLDVKTAFDEAFEQTSRRESHTGQDDEWDGHAAAHYARSEKQDIDTEEDEDGHQHTSEYDPHLVPAGVASRVRVETVEPKNQREDGRKQPEESCVMLSEANDQISGRCSVTEGGPVDH
jgi:hypothetical protein